MEKLASASYTLTEAAYAANELADTWVQILLVALITSFQFLSPLLSPEMFDSLAMTTLDKVCFSFVALLLFAFCLFRLRRFMITLFVCGVLPEFAEEKRAVKQSFGVFFFIVNIFFSLTSSTIKKIIFQLKKKIVERIEAVLRLKRFNQLGGLQLDRDVRMLVATLSEVVPGTVRERFGRLSEMSTLLSFESPTEILDYSSVSWKLTETQIREVLSQRFDFDQREIATLQL